MVMSDRLYSPPRYAHAQTIKGTPALHDILILYECIVSMTWHIVAPTEYGVFRQLDYTLSDIVITK